MKTVEPMRLALIDDHELVREGLRALLEEKGDGDVDVVYSGESPADAVGTGATVALLDVDLGPGSDPVAASTRLLSDAGAAVLLISAFEDAASIRSGLAAGALGFVPKRVSYDVLSEALVTAARGELFLSVDLASILASAPEAPELSPRELDALRLYASGLKLAAVAVVITGVIGTIVSHPLLKVLKVTDPAARGFAIGLTAHAIGMARELQVNPATGSFAALAMGLNAILTAVLMPLLTRIAEYLNGFAPPPVARTWSAEL